MWSQRYPTAHGACVLARFLARSPHQPLDYPAPWLRHRLVSADGAETVAMVCILSSGEPYVNIFVGNLAFTTSEQDLRQLFESYGTVETVRIMTDREIGRSRGFGCVEMPDSRAAHRAMDALSGTPLAGRVLTVNETRPRARPWPPGPINVHRWTAHERRTLSGEEVADGTLG